MTESQKPEETRPDSSMETGLITLSVRALDIALGFAALGVEAAGNTARYLAENGPEWLEELARRGRPLRQQALGVAGSVGSSEELSGEEEISALERRIRELEKEVGGEVGSGGNASERAPDLSPGPSSGPFVAPDIDDDSSSGNASQ